VQLPSLLLRLEKNLTFKPDSVDYGFIASRPHQRLTIGREFGLKLDAAFIDNSSPIVVLFAHGNKWNMTWFAAQYALFDALGLSYLTFDYPGYGASVGEPSEAALYASLRAAYAHLTHSLHFTPVNIVVYGLSLGAAVAADLLQEVNTRCFISECAFTSSRDMARHLYPYLPISWMFPNRFLNEHKFAHLRTPLFIMHGDDDEIAPVDHAYQLYKQALGPKVLRVVEGATHRNCLEIGGNGLIEELRAFLAGSASTAPHKG
jgi:fermentation-respiration switch protein FrsA (DUF1100 family)